MLELKGRYNVAKVFTDNIEETAIGEIINLCNQEFTKDSKIRIMPDVHAGMGCVIGTTMTIKDKIVPNLVGVDIGCGMVTIKLDDVDLDLPKLDQFIRSNIPSGFNINEHAQVDFKDEITNLKCFRDIPKSSKEFNRALGSLGGGNHFIEVDIDDENNKYLIIHSGSRNLGNQVARYYQNKAYDYHNGIDEKFEEAKLELIKNYKAMGKRKEIQNALKKLQLKHKKECKIPKDLCYLEGILMQNYLHDMKIVQQYANLNRKVMAKRIVEECLGLEYNKLHVFQTIHNYIDLENMILRKGSISAQCDEIVLIPINMRDGCIIAKGKGNPEWNYSAPHGAGRLMSRGKAKELIILNDFKETMKDIYSSSVGEHTLDEAPMAYKPIEEILNNIGDTVEILKIIKPIYNFKA
ncbi:RNA-splicing ligase RtcB, repairs tRNA damage [Anaerovirgula multivorans]|uniref:3'-phosphate/5'-hydroxy nucleic acid ligase n=1 Tax=Anaerovirgula multivorans TaxID=312168 RepID=A0A239CU66_9FIRM|nr:RtcB family protein [Anaerovirgula multivorans]SNS23786.1 RNA-splicing ligase RtcB, repairs tRNA damage [Anaerovirgula multivorans]